MQPPPPTTPPPLSPTRRSHLGELLVEEGKLSHEELEAALAYRESRGMKLGQALVALHLVTQQDLAHALRSQGKVACLHLTPGIVDRDIACLLPKEMARQLVALPIHRVAGRVTVAMEDPSESYDVDAITVALGEPVFAVHAEPERILEAIEVAYGPGADPDAAAAEGAAPPPTHPRFTLLRSDELAGNPHSGVESLLEGALLEARAIGADALHVDATQQGTELSLRVGGQRTATQKLAPEWAQPLSDEIARRAGLPGDDPTGARHGSARIEVGGEVLELDVALVATVHGPCAVLRLAHQRPPVALDALGLDPEELQLVRRWCARGGLILLAGPEGSGRTETACALLDDLARQGRRVAARVDAELSVQACVTRRPGREECAVEEIRSLLALAPDALYVDEIGSAEVAGTLARAALSGVLVIARVPTPDGAHAARRLLALGIEPLVAADILRGTISQRALHAICPRCAEAVDPPRRDCGDCAAIGRDGRITIREVVDWSSGLQPLLETGASTAALSAEARALGFAGLRERGEALVRAGWTTAAEVERALFF